MDENVKKILEDKIDNDDLHLFMKGTPLFPECGFSSNDKEHFKRMKSSVSNYPVENFKKGWNEKIAPILKKAKELEKKMKESQEAIKKIEVIGNSGGDLVKVKLNETKNSNFTPL